MTPVSEFPFLRVLKKIDVAKLLSRMQESAYEQGDEFELPAAAEWIVFVISGQAELIYPSHPPITVTTLHEADILNPPSQSHQPRRFRALTTLRVCQLPRAQIEALLLREPTLARELIRSLSRQLQETLTELFRAKWMLNTYAAALWEQVPDPELPSHMPATAAATQQAGAMTESVGKGIAEVTRRSPFGQWRFWLSILCTLGPILLYRFLPGERILVACSAIIIWTALNWLLETMPDYVVGLLSSALMVITGVASTTSAFSGFASTSWILLVGAGGMGVAVARSGLLYRIALYLLKLLPPTYLGQSLALALTGVLFTPLLPSANSRVAMASPLALELGEALRFPERGRGTTGLAMANYLGFGLMYFLFMNGANTGLLAWSLMPDAVRERLTWISWFWAALPMGLIVFVGCFFALHRLYPAESSQQITREMVATQIQVLGPLGHSERLTLWTLLAVLLGFMTQGLHHLDPAWVALGGTALLISTGVIDKNGIKTVDWNFLLLFGSLVSLSDLLKNVGLNELLANWLQPFLERAGDSPILFLSAVALITLVVRLVLPLQPTVFLLVVTLTPVALKLQYSPFILALIVLAVSNTWLIPQQNSIYTGVYSATEGRAFSHAMTRPFAWVYALACLVAIIASIPIWNWMHLIPA